MCTVPVSWNWLIFLNPVAVSVTGTVLPWWAAGAPEQKFVL